MKKLIDFFRKRKIFKAALELGCDVDGDIVVYKGVTYFVHIQLNDLRRVPKKEWEKPQWKITDRNL